MTHQIRTSATYAERAERLEATRQEYITFRKKIQRDSDLQKYDGRLAFLYNTISFSRFTVVMLRLFQWCANDHAFAMTVFGLKKASMIEPTISDANGFIKLSWCTQFQFQIENLFRNILKSLAEPVPDAYWRICEGLLETLAIEDKTHCQNVLNILAFIRNSQHANGTHFGYKEQDTVVEVDGVVFEFKHGEVVRCASWDHLVHAYSNVLPILKQIYCSTKVSQIKDLPDSFY